MLDKSRGLNVDCIAYDLEDSVTPSKKPEARKAIAKFLDQPRAAGIRENAVRINAVESGLALDDLSEVVRKDFAIISNSALNVVSSKPQISTPSLSRN